MLSTAPRLAGCAIALTLLPAAGASARTTLSDGHVDAVSARLVSGKLKLQVKDATGSRVRWRDPNDVTLRVTSRARVTLPRDGSLSFVGGGGSTAWLIPQAQRSGVLWAGWNTEEVSSRQLRGSLTWRLSRVRGPGRVVLYQTGSFGKPDILFTTARSMPQSRTLPLGVHAHGNWAFTRKGTYRMTFSLKGTSRSGERLSATRALNFRVG